MNYPDAEHTGYQKRNNSVFSMQSIGELNPLLIKNLKKLGSLNMKYKFIFFFIFLLLLLANPQMSAHSGRTDSSGGHYNRKKGGYHYHNSGRNTKNSYKKVKDYYSEYAFKHTKKKLKKKYIKYTKQNIKLKMLLTKGNKLFRNVTILKSSKNGIEILHKSGVSFIPSKEIPLKIKNLL
jgi:hypothetical protein